ncbi:MAG: hypothetical protein K8M05_17000, partial [Deltaproteobacteria bacterium]|nr:hypothetical protein [Kofleriaceae bacterium]
GGDRLELSLDDGTTEELAYASSSVVPSSSESSSASRTRARGRGCARPGRAGRSGRADRAGWHVGC